MWWRKLLHFVWPPSQTITMLPGEIDALMLEGIKLETAFQNNAHIHLQQNRACLDQWLHFAPPAGRWERNFVFSCAEVDADSWSFLESWYKDQLKNQ